MKIKLFITVILLGIYACLAANSNNNRLSKTDRQHVVTIVCPENAPSNIKLAAREVRRYIYLRTGQLLPILESASGNRVLFNIDKTLDEQQYKLKSDGKSLEISGGSDVAVLYGTYAFAEKLGVRFELNGDVIPSAQIPFAIPPLDETHKPLFALRGLQPFHDFPEGPDWWTQDQWRLFLGQSVKMRMNFVGLHCYPFKNKDLGPEPLVWIGLPGDVNADGTVKRSDEASWYTTAKYMPYGCYAPGKTSDYGFGGANLFVTDNYGPEVNAPTDFPMPKTPEAKTALINRTGKMFNTIFTEARGLGVKVAVGTEAPLDIPTGVLQQLKEKNMNPQSPETLRKLYGGMFTRIQRAFPIDYYWLWGYEGEIDENAVIENILQAHYALTDVKAPFGLGVCGWGWTAEHFPSLNKALPKDIAFSAINMSTGHSPVSANFGKLGDRSRWAIPWLEDDGHMISMQFRAGRIRRDAVDAHNFGCNGLMGIFWRTRIMSPNITALAQAGWNQGNWGDKQSREDVKSTIEVIGGNTATYLNNSVANAEPEPIYQTLRYGMGSYRFNLPNGVYKLTLHFVEPEYTTTGKRVFSVKVQDKELVHHLDIFAKVGQFAAIKMPFDGINVINGNLTIDFVKETGYPCISGIELTGNGLSYKINCGGQAYQDFAADPATREKPRDLVSEDLYQDWATAQFGPEIGNDAASILSDIDGNFPTPSSWIKGPGGIVVNPKPWTDVENLYKFVDQFAALRTKVKGAGELERFDFWLNTLRFNKYMGEFGCACGDLDSIMKNISNEKDRTAQLKMAGERALPKRLQMNVLSGNMITSLIQTISNSTELGTLCNVEQQSMLRLKRLNAHDAKLEELLGKPLPEAAFPWKDYRGTSRLVVMNGRTALNKGEAQTLQIIVLDQQPVQSVVVKIRRLGKGEWKTVEAKHVARAVWNATLPAAKDDFEYQIVSKTATGAKLVWPATAPDINQTVVVKE